MNLVEILSNQKAELESVDVSGLCSRREETEFDLNSRLAQIVIGVRRSGKSTLCQKVLLQSGVSFAYINFDDENLVSLKAEDMNDVMSVLYRIYGEFTHLFIDEVQNLEGWPLFINRLLRQGMKLVLTGSNANLLSGELATHLNGRYNQIVLFPFSFAEYCTALNVDMEQQTTKAAALRSRALDRYLFDGGFPELIGEKNHRKYVLSLLSAIIKKDICRRYAVKYKQTLSDMANGILDKFCQEVSYRMLASEYQLSSIHTAKNYLQYLANAYLITLLPKYSFKTSEKQQARKCYAVDPAFITNHEDVVQTENLGWRLENVAAIELMRRYSGEYQQLFYLKKHLDFEVDFVVRELSQVKELIQVTYDFRNPSKKLYNREVGGLLKGSELTGCQNLTLIMMEGEEKDLVIDGKTVHCVSAVNWLTRVVTY
ncbi:MAG TPA: ATP-binding protein [Methanocorpusculum sp.]|nr:ATP-binding protein [Methanocorpusculum sp.]